MSESSTNHLPASMAQTDGLSERWGNLEALCLRTGPDREHSLSYAVDNDLRIALARGESRLTSAEGGYLLLRFDVDGEDYTCTHVDPPAGWWPNSGRAPTDLVRRGATYLGALADKLEQIEALA